MANTRIFPYLSSIFSVLLIVSLSPIIVPFPCANAQLDYYYYVDTCPEIRSVVQQGVSSALKDDPRLAASLLRLHFHDCFVNGCDASILLNGTKSFRGEKNALPNRNSARGYEVIDSIKADAERVCPSTVSCADILALAAKEAVVLSNGPEWLVELGRRDGVTSFEKAANENLPAPFDSLQNITARFVSKGLNLKDVVALSGAHTIGYAQCITFKRRLFSFKGTGKPDPSLDSGAVADLQTMCPDQDSSNTDLVTLDVTDSVYKFDNSYYSNIVKNNGLLESDQALLSGDPASAALVNSYASSTKVFFRDFAASMGKMGSLGILTGNQGQIRKKCWSLN
ncbi:Peroxidase superfamily protein [Euphorbia peplus]|nr:Peroxidase superfamily protein [Euphorbia peplus]